MTIETSAVPKAIEKVRPDPAPLRDEMRPARGVIVGLVLSLIVWLGLLAVWLAF